MINHWFFVQFNYNRYMEKNIFRLEHFLVEICISSHNQLNHYSINRSHRMPDSANSFSAAVRPCHTKPKPHLHDYRSVLNNVRTITTKEKIDYRKSRWNWFDIMWKVSPWLVPRPTLAVSLFKARAPFCIKYYTITFRMWSQVISCITL